MPRQRRPAAQTVVLPETLDLTQAGELAKTLRAARGTDVVLDASAVGRVGTQCVQVLLAAKAAWEGDRAKFKITRPSDALTEALRLIGLHSALPIEEPSL